jgi:hypothetical protein
VMSFAVYVVAKLTSMKRPPHLYPLPKGARTFIISSPLGRGLGEGSCLLSSVFCPLFGGDYKPGRKGKQYEPCLLSEQRVLGR